MWMFQQMHQETAQRSKIRHDREVRRKVPGGNRHRHLDQENQKKPSLQMKQPFFNKLGGIPFERKFVSKKHLTVQIS